MRIKAKGTPKIRPGVGVPGSDTSASGLKKIGFLRWCIVQKAHYEVLYKAEAALRESEARYHTTLISIGDGIITTNADGRVELLNPVAEALTGWKLDEARGRPLEEVFHIVNEETRRKVENPVCRVVREGLVIGLANHTLLIARDGTEHAVADSGAPIRNEAGEITGVVLVFRDQTEERAAHKAMREERLRLRTLIDAMPDYIFVKDAESRFVTTNSAHLKVIGAASLEEVIGKTDLELFPADLAEQYYKDERRIIDSGEPMIDREERVIEHSGAEKYVLTTKIPLRDEQGHVTGLVGISRDISERKRAEEALRDSEARYHALFEASADGILIADIETKILRYANAAMCRMLGYTEEELRTMGVADIHPKDALQSVVGEFDAQAQGKKSLASNIPCLRRDGTIFFADINTVNTKIDGRECNVGIFRDITERKRAESERLRTAQRWQNTFDAISDIVCIISRDLEFQAINEAGVRALGISREEIIGRKCYELMHRAQGPIPACPGTATLKTGAEGSNEYEQDGRYYWLRALPIKGQSGHVDSFVHIVQDITERKKDEEKLRTALEERETMLREIHHRVKNNIQIISSLLRLQSRYVKDEIALEVLNESQNRIKSMALIHEKLYQSGDFSRIDFSDYIAKMITHLFAIYKVDSRGIRYKVDAKNVQLDISRAIPCGLIINELITNALKHAFPEDREGEIFVRMRPSDGDGYELAVKDNGVGMPEGFDMRQNGTLGFQIVSDLVKQIDGSIEIRRDAGTEIIIRW